MSYSFQNIAGAIGSAFLLSLVPVAPVLSAEDKKPVNVDVMISPAGTGPYLAWATIQTYAKDHHSWLRPKAVEAPGFVYNVRYAAANPQIWKTTLFGSGEVVEFAAINGLAPFFKKPLANVKDFRVIGTMSQTSNLFVATDPKIQSPTDFAGKRIATGLLSQNEWGMHQRLILDGMNVTPKTASYSPLGPNANVEALLDGRADVGTVVLHSALGFKNNLEAGPFKTSRPVRRAPFGLRMVTTAISETTSRKTRQTWIV